jgi:hypothetical protein
MGTMRRIPGSASGPFNKMLADLDKANVRVGWFESSKYPDEANTPVAYVAAINELGPNKRPFMSTAAEAHDKDWGALMFQLSKQVVKGALTVEQALDAVGLACGADIQKQIASIAAAGGLSTITLVARAYRKQGMKVTGATIGQIARMVKKNPQQAQDEITDAGIRDTPLNDTGYMIATVSSSVNDKAPIPVTGV